MILGYKVRPIVCLLAGNRKVLQGETKQTCYFYSKASMIKAKGISSAVNLHKHTPQDFLFLFYCAPTLKDENYKLSLYILKLSHYYNPIRDSQRCISNIALRFTVACCYHKHSYDICVNNDFPYILKLDSVSEWVNKDK